MFELWNRNRREYMRMNMGMGMIDDVDDWKRDMCIKMPIMDSDSSRCITPDGDVGSCYGCRYHVRNIYRVDR